MRNIISNFIILLCIGACKKETVKEPPPVEIIVKPVEDAFYPCDYDVFWLAARQAESGDNPNAVYHEPPPLGYDSLGVYQTSPEDAKGYPECSPVREDHFNRIKAEECKNGIVKKLRTKYPTETWDRNLGRYWAIFRSKRAWGDKARNGFTRFKSYAAKKGCVINFE